jgi:integrase
MWKREDTYYARFRAGGRLIRKRLSTDYQAACTILTELRARASRGEFNLIDNDYPYVDLKREFLKWAQQAVKHFHEYERDLKTIETYMGVKSAKQLDQQYVLGFRSWRADQLRGNEKEKGKNRVGRSMTVSPRTINKEVGTLRCMLNKAVEWGYIASNPMEGLKPLKQAKPRKDRRALSADEVEAIFTHSPEHLKPVWRMFMVTGMRLGELVGLTFDDIDFEARTVVIQAHRAKSGKAREIPLDDDTLAMLTALQDSAGGREAVFVSTRGNPLENNLLRRFHSVCKKAGIDGAEPGGSVDIHSLRVSFTTLALEHGANPKAIQAILGHSTLGLTMGVYARASEKSKRDAISSLPFTKTVSAPAHIVSVHDAHKVSTPRHDEAQTVKMQQVTSEAS